MGGCLGQFTKAKGQKLGVQGGEISLTPQFETLVLVYLLLFFYAVENTTRFWKVELLWMEVLNLNDPYAGIYPLRISC